MEKSVPECLIYNGGLVQHMFRNDREIQYYINDIFITETYGNNTQVISSVGQKEKVNVTVTGQIKSDYISNDFRLLKNGNELYEQGVNEFNLKHKTLNITYYNVRVRTDYNYRNGSHSRKLYVDTTHSFYDFLRPVLVNQELIDVHENGNITMKPNDIMNVLRGLVTLKGTEKTDYNSISKQKYVHYKVKCEKGDNDGE